MTQSSAAIPAARRGGAGFPSYLLTLPNKRGGTRAPARPATPLRGQEKMVSLGEGEIARFEVLIRMRDGVLTPQEAQGLLSLSRSQVYKLLAKFRVSGPPALTSKKRGRPSNRAYPATLRAKVIQIIHDDYSDYGPTLVAEMLDEVHNMKFSTETIRQWMIAAGLWMANRLLRSRLHRPRKRLPYYGDLIQMDGSDHEWFEDRAPRCTLMVMIDDATGALQHLQFFTRENRRAYVESTRRYVEIHGRPVRIYTDKHSAVWSDHGPTDYGKALQKLTIAHSIANTPQAKGRVERANRTLQDRLVKALRRLRISEIDRANAYLPAFIAHYNEKFAKPAFLRGDNHSPLARKEDLNRAFARTYVRRVTKQLTFSFRGKWYQLAGTAGDRERVGPRVEIELYFDGTMNVYGRSGRLAFEAI